MKRILLITVVSAMSAVAFWGCKFLEVEVLGKNDIPKFFSNMDGLRTGYIGMYRVFYDFYDSYYMKYPEIAGDMVDLRAGIDDMLDQYRYISLPSDDTSAVSKIWEEGYTALANINNILQYAPGLADEYPAYKDEVNRIRAEAYFMRALTHLLICNVYAMPYSYTGNGSHMGIPYLKYLPSGNDKIPRDNVSSVYGYINSDLTESLKLFGALDFPSKGTANRKQDKYYASAIACKALQARVALYMQDWAAAIGYAGELTGAGISELSLTRTADYEDLMQIYNQDNPGDETIFRISGYGTTSRNLWKFYKDGASGRASDKLFATFYDDNDVRLSLADRTGRSIRKYDNPALENTSLTDVIPYGPIVLRLSEMYLIRAEAYCETDALGLAAEELKIIMARAVGKQPSEITLTYADKDELMGFIERERILEFYGEGHRLFDIVRRKQDLVRTPGNASGVDRLRYSVESERNKFVLPISKREIDANDAIIQNPGYPGGA